MITQSAHMPLTCRALGLLASKLSTSPSIPSNVVSPGSEEPPTLNAINVLRNGVCQLLSNNTGLHKIVAALVVYHWEGCPREALCSRFLSALTEMTDLEETLPFIMNMQKDCQVIYIVHCLQTPVLFVCLFVSLLFVCVVSYYCI